MDGETSIDQGVVEYALGAVTKHSQTLLVGCRLS